MNCVLYKICCDQPPSSNSSAQLPKNIRKRISFTMATSVDISTLPEKLQFAILIHIPPNQLFTLRRVSHSWKSMLTSPQLLEDINIQLPFLSSAPNLTSRMKRRMRMARGEPVWVKSWSEAFSWTKDFFRPLRSGKSRRAPTQGRVGFW